MSEDDVVTFDKIDVNMEGMQETAKGALRAVVTEAASMGEELKRLTAAYNTLLEEGERMGMVLREKEGVIEALRREEAEDVEDLKNRQGTLIKQLRDDLAAAVSASSQKDHELNVVQHEVFTIGNALSGAKLEAKERERDQNRERDDMSARMQRMGAENSERASTITSLNFEHRTLTDTTIMQQKEIADLHRSLGKMRADLEAQKRLRDNGDRTLEQETRHLRAHNERLERERADLEAEAAEARQRERAAQSNSDRLDSELHAIKLRHTTEIDGLRRVWDDEKRLLERELEDRKDEADLFEANLDRNRREIQNLYVELDEARDQCTEAERREEERKAENTRLQEDLRELSKMMRTETARLQTEAEEADLKQRNTALQLQQAKGQIVALENDKKVLELANSEIDIDRSRLQQDVDRLKKELEATRHVEAKLRVEIKKLEMVLSQKDAVTESLRRKLQDGHRNIVEERQDVERLTDAVQKATDRLRVANLQIEEVFANGGKPEDDDAEEEDEESEQGGIYGRAGGSSVFAQSKMDLSRAGNLQQSMADLRAAFDEDNEEYEPAILPDEVVKVEGFTDQLLALLQMHKWEEQDRVRNADDEMTNVVDDKNSAIKNLEDHIRRLKGELDDLYSTTAACKEAELAEETDRRQVEKQQQAEFETLELRKSEAEAYFGRQRIYALEDWEVAQRRQIVEAETAALNSIALQRDLKEQRRRADMAEHHLALLHQEEMMRSQIKAAEQSFVDAFENNIAVVRSMHVEGRKRALEEEEEDLRADIEGHEASDREMLVLQFKLEEEKRKVEEGFRLRRAMQDKHELVRWEEGERMDLLEDEQRGWDCIVECAAGVKMEYLQGKIYELEYDEAEQRLDIEDLEEGEWNIILHDADIDFEAMIEKLRKKRLRELRAQQKKTAYMGIQVSDGINIRGGSGTETHLREREHVSKLLKEGVPVKGRERTAGPSRSGDGVKVFSVAPNGPSDLAGISSDDVILRFNNTATRTLSDFKSIAKKVKPGEVVRFTVWREGDEVEVKVQTVEVNEDDFEQGLRRKIGHRITVLKSMKEETTRLREQRRKDLKSDRTAGLVDIRSPDRSPSHLDRVPPAHAPRSRESDPAATHSLAGANAGPMTNGMFVQSKRLNAALALDYHEESAQVEESAAYTSSADSRHTEGSPFQQVTSKPKLWKK